MHGKRAVVVDTGAITGTRRAGSCRVARDAAVIESKGATCDDIDAAARLAFFVGDLANNLFAVGDGQGRSAFNLDGVFILGPGDGVAVKAEVDFVAALPGVGESNIGVQVVIAV